MYPNGEGIQVLHVPKGNTQTAIYRVFPPQRCDRGRGYLRHYTLPHHRPRKKVSYAGEIAALNLCSTSPFAASFLGKRTVRYRFPGTDESATT